MTAQDLKNSILQLAVEGKLLKGGSLPLATAGKPSSATPSAGTPRNAPSDPKTGAELLEQIKAEKARLIAEGKLKKDKPIEPITEDEKPFDIPENWCWCRLGEVISFVGGYAFKSSDFIKKSDNQVIRLGNVKNNLLLIDQKQVFVNDEIAKNAESFKILPNDILVSMTGTRGKGDYFFTVHIDKTFLKRSLYINQRVGCLRSLNELNSKWLCLILQSNFMRTSIFEHETGTANQGNIGSEDIKNMLLPLPPLAEQKAIVAKIEELLPYIQKYDVAHTKLEEFNKKFPVEMQKSILQQAIMGKLTEDWRNEQASLAKTNSAVQLADRTSAKDLLKKIKAQKARLIAEGKIKKDTTKAGASGRALAEITEEEIPFDIPESWCWCRLGDICFDIKRGKSPKYVEKSNYLAFAQKCNVKTGGINLEIALYLDESTISRYSNTDCLVQGDVVINSTGGGTMGRVGYFECEIPKGIKGIYPDSHVTTIRTVGFMEQKFVFYFLKTKQKELESLGEGSTNQTELKPYTLQNLLLPLPPLAEQKVIVAKIEELLPLCKKLVK